MSQQLNDAIEDQSQRRAAFARLAWREKTVEHLRVQCGVSAALLVLHTVLCAWFLFSVVPDLAEWSIIAGTLFTLAIAWFSLRGRPLYTVAAICAILAFSDSVSSNKEVGWSNLASTACIGLLIYISRMRIPSYSRRLSEKIYEAIVPTSSIEADERSKNRLLQFALKSLTIALAMGFFAYVTAFLLAFLLSNMPMQGSDALWRRIAIDANDQFWPPAWLIVTVVAIAVLLFQWEWRRIDAAQASMYVRNENLRWQYRDLRRILKSRRKIFMITGRVDSAAPQERLR